MTIRAYIRRGRAALREDQAAREALNFDYCARRAHGGPWDEDDTYLRLNDNVHFRASTLLGVLLRRTIYLDDPYPWRVGSFAEQVGMILRHCTETERGVWLADRWDIEHGVNTAAIAAEDERGEQR